MRQQKISRSDAKAIHRATQGVQRTTLGAEVKTQSAEESEIAKRRKFEAADEAMRKALAELKNNETVVQINPDKESNNVAEDSITLLKKVSAFLGKSHFEAAESLLRHLYRITTQPDARKALSSARKLCHEAVKQENKWVRRRATLLRHKTKAAKIRQERLKYSQDWRMEIADFLSTAMLEIAEGIDKRSGNFYTNLASSFEVILPPITSGSMVLARAPVMFNAKKYLDERRFKDVIYKAHKFDPGLKRIERGFFVCNTIAMVGLATPIENADGNKNKRERQIRKLEREMEEKLKRAVSVVPYALSHRSSKLFWYVYDFPVEVEMMQFADVQVAEDYGGVSTPYGDMNTPLLQLDNGRLSRDEFVKIREAARQRSQAIRQVQLREARLAFNAKYADVTDKIKQLRDVAEEFAEKMAKLRHEFALKTATKVDEEKNNGLPIGQYKRLATHTRKMYRELAEQDPSQRDRLALQLFQDRMTAREIYYEYRDMNARRVEFLEHAEHLERNLAQTRNITRGTGKNLLPELDLVA